jgi:hypothetical protein
MNPGKPRFYQVLQRTDFGIDSPDLTAIHRCKAAFQKLLNPLIGLKQSLVFIKGKPVSHPGDIIANHSFAT